MLSWLKRPAPHQKAAEALYAAIVDQARQPPFYSALGAPDTYEGRFEVIALHMALALDRLSQQGQAGLDTGRALNEVFVGDMDDNMREIGVGDLTVPRKVKKAAAAVYDRARSLRAALAEPNDKALEAIIAVNVHVQGSTTTQSQADDGDLSAFAAYVRRAAASLAGQDLATGQVTFPAPVAA
ncbi:MAG: hypothetical protein RL291_778 [Pseudomonadota bacterium]|jgi:cytochrome b pre-mRNA-processing protein 3